MDIEAWLRGLSLDRYAELFRANDIEPDVVPDLTDADLSALGVSLGDRKRLLRSIATLRGPVVRPPAPVRSRAERRQLTVMFVDLVGSTALSVRLDPEELRDVIHAYQTTVASEITKLEGHVAKFMGDGVLAYFGWPRAHEDEPERAVRAGLAATLAVARLSLPGGGFLAARVGIATGLVVVGDLIGEGAAQEEAVIGVTPNLTARLQALAEPGTVVIADGTRRLLGRLFDFIDLGPRSLSGFANPITAFRVVEARAPQSRFDALHGQHQTPLVGREDDLELLLDRWRQARDGAGQVVLLVGEPGIGKSRLVQDVRDRVSGEPHIHLRYLCSPFHQNTAFHPILDQIETAARFDRDEPADAKLGKLEALFAATGDQAAEAAALTATLLGIPTEGRYPTSPIGPRGRKAKLQGIWLQQLVGLAARCPVLMLLEDAHWIDPSSIEQFELAIDRIQRSRVMLVVTFRPGFPQLWGRHAHVTTLSLDRLSPHQSRAMVERVAGGKALPRPVVDQIVAKADGVPLFLEELTKTVKEAGLLEDAGDQWRLTMPLPPLAIPASLHDSLIARLDRLTPVKEVAQIAAAIGRQFPHDLLSAVARLDEPSLDDALAQLAAAELIFRGGVAPDGIYTFKHALVQDAAYASLLRGPRQLIHSQIAAALQGRGTNCLPEVLAHHLTEAGRADQAVELWAQAGREAVARAASKEAVAHFRRALAQLMSLPDTVGRKRREATLQSALGNALVHVTGPASEALAQVHVRARDLYRDAGDAKPQFIAEWNLWHVYHARAEHAAADALAGHLMVVAEQGQDPELVLQACHVEWVALAAKSEYRATQICCERGWTLYDPERHRAHAFTYGAHDPGVCSRNIWARSTWILGRPDRARACQEQALALARQLDHPLILVNALARSLPLLQLCRDRDTLEARAAATIELAAEQGFPNYRIDAEILRAWALSDRTEPEITIRMIQAGLAERQNLGSMWTGPYFLSLLARAQARGGAVDEALVTLGRALEQARSTGEVWAEPDLLRLEGELLLKTKDFGAAETCFKTALAMARATSTRAWELRSAISLARLWASQGRGAEAGRLLMPVFQAFDEGLDTPDLKDARTLLTELV